MTESVPDLVADGIIVRLRRGCYSLAPAHDDGSVAELERSERLLRIRAHAWLRVSSGQA